jgi:hypothetical protein
MNKIWIIKPQYLEEVIIHTEDELHQWCHNIFTSNKHQFMGKINIKEIEIASESDIDFDGYVESMIRNSRIEGLIEDSTPYRVDLEDFFNVIPKELDDRIDWIRKCIDLNGWKESYCRKILGTYKRVLTKTIPSKIDEGKRQEYFDKLAKVKNFEPDNKVNINTIKIK